MTFKETILSGPNQFGFDRTLTDLEGGKCPNLDHSTWGKENTQFQIPIAFSLTYGNGGQVVVKKVTSQRHRLIK